MLKRAYYYLFYKFYKISEAAPSRWLSEWKASLAIDVLVLFILFSGVNYYNVFIDKTLAFDNKLLFAFLYIALIAMPNYFIFNHRNKWKEIVVEFDKRPNSFNRTGSWLVTLFVIIVIANLCFSFYLMSLVDWGSG